MTLEKNEFIKIIPFYVQHNEADYIKFNFDSLEELLEHDIIKRCKFINNISKCGFYRYALHGNYILAEFGEGKVSFVIGYVKFPERLDLPQHVKCRPCELVRSI